MPPPKTEEWITVPAARFVRQVHHVVVEHREHRRTADMVERADDVPVRRVAVDRRIGIEEERMFAVGLLEVGET
jgi:hypothetical protein